MNKEDCMKKIVPFKKEILLAEHSPIRLLEYDFTIENIRQWVTCHLVRHHKGCEKFVNSQRQDINNDVENITKTIIVNTSAIAKYVINVSIFFLQTILVLYNIFDKNNSTIYIFKHKLY